MKAITVQIVSYLIKIEIYIMVNIIKLLKLLLNLLIL